MDSKHNLRSVFRSLVKSPQDWALMMILADALEDVGAEDLAAAYRWAASRKKWPFQCTGHRFPGTGEYGRKVYDWDSDSLTRSNNNVLEHARLPHEMYKVMANPHGLPGQSKKYGGIHRAFVLLARTMKVVQKTEVGVST
jgi:hypothetical protein